MLASSLLFLLCAARSVDARVPGFFVAPDEERPLKTGVTAAVLEVLTPGK